MIRLTKEEKRDLKYYGYNPEDILEPPSNQEIDSLILISRGRKTLHDSGYPFILVLGSNTKTHQLYDLGDNHDAIWFPDDYSNSSKQSEHNVNVDSLGKNIFRIWRRGKLNIKFGKASSYGSTLTCMTDGIIS